MSLPIVCRLRPRMWLGPLLLLVAASAAGQSPSAAGQSPSARLEAALDRLGGPDVLSRTGTVVMVAEGVQDRGAERQGTRPDSRNPGAYSETLAWAPVEGQPRVAFEYRHDRDDGTREWLREVYDPPDRKTIVGLGENGFAVVLVSEAHLEEQRRHLRRFPPLLVAELLERPEVLRHVDGGIVGSLSDGTRVVVSLTDGMPASVAYTLTIPTLGDVPVVWRFGDYRRVEGLGAFPHRYSVEVAGRTWIDQRVRQVRVGAPPDELFAVPEAYAPARVVELPAEADASARASVERLGEGVWRVRALRPGFHPLFVELADGLLVVDAPSGYPLLAQLPAGDVAPGPSPDWLSRRFLELVRETVPDKPVTHVVVTHFHGDHAGGLRAFVDAGARVLAPRGDAEAIRAWLDVDAEQVTETRELDGGAVVVHPIGDNPHAAGMLAVEVERAGLLFVSDLFHPAPLEEYPTPGYADLDRAFARWIAGTRLRPERIYTMHTLEPGGFEHVDAALDHRGLPAGAATPVQSSRFLISSPVGSDADR